MRTGDHKSMIGFVIKIFVMTIMASDMSSVIGDRDFANNTFADDQCEIGQDNPGTFVVTCSCKENQNLSISGSDTALLSSAVTQFHIQHCNNSAVVLETNALSSFHQLKNISFTSIGNLVLESNSTNLHLFHHNDFSLSFEGILGLGVFLEQDAINIKRNDGVIAKEQLVIQNTIIRGLMDSAIHGTFSKLQLDKVILTDLAGTRAIDVGDTGAEVSINAFHAINQGLGPKWLSGSVKALTITESNLVMKPAAFAGIKMRGPPPLKIEMENNQFGTPIQIPSNNQTHSEPSLPSGVFDFEIPTDDLSVTTKNNQITCECDDLIWLLETSKNGLQSRMNFICVQGNLPSALEKCKLPLVSSSPEIKSVLGLFLPIVLVVTLM